MKSLISKLCAAGLFSTLAMTAHASQSLDVQVKAVEGNVVTVQSAAALPFWVQNDVRVLAAGWGSAIQGIDGSTFKLHFDSNQQDALKPMQPLTIHRQAEGSEPDGITCG